jgi:hypothetical protein
MSREAALQKRKELQMKGQSSRAFGAGAKAAVGSAAAPKK